MRAWLGLASGLIFAACSGTPAQTRSEGATSDAAVGSAGQSSPMTGASAGASGTVSSSGAAVTALAGRNAAGMSTAAGAAGPRGAAAGSTAAAGGSARAGSAAGASAAGSGGAGTAATGGMTASTTCEFPDPPSNVAGWVDESWDAQLGMNIKARKAWNLDNVMLNKGQMNLCVRWGATMAVPEEVRMNLASTVERWFNDWFKGLAAYGCFPYGDGIKVKITGWAVRAGRESLLQGVDPSIPVYTEQDGDGEPKCPDACSSFVHWDHDFSDCEKGAALHSDYWLWFDDMLPGGGGAAAVGGDWGLRMPVSTFLDAFSKPSDHIVEHEMGHGFGIQDYYDWRGSKPDGGSIMIVGSTQSEAPTPADIWLLKRTWKEMKTLRGW